MLAGCDTRSRYDVDETTVRFPFASSLSEAIATCKKRNQTHLEADLYWMKTTGGRPRFHTDEKAIRQVISMTCDWNTVEKNKVSRKRGLDLGEICSVNGRADVRVQKLIPDETVLVIHSPQLSNTSPANGSPLGYG